MLRVTPISAELVVSILITCMAACAALFIAFRVVMARLFPYDS
jgi:hypothetical protein